MAQAANKATALWVLRRLREAGFEALFAGGCVRDMLLGVRSNDYDVATNATPREVRKLFRRVLLVGAKFGVAMVIHKRRRVEVTTFRSDLSYSDGRRPEGVRFTTARQDALRRDFTINGLFYDPLTDRVFDYIGGRRDLDRNLIRAIGPADKRFAEDYLRMIRAVRFSERLGFPIAPATAKAIRRLAPKVAAISGERIFDELKKMLSLPSAGQALRTLEDCRLAEVILPELVGGDLWPVAIRRVELLAGKRDFALTMTGLLCQLPPRTISALCRRWGASNDLRDGFLWCAENLSRWPVAVDMPLADFKRLLAGRHWRRLLSLWRAQERIETGRQIACRRIARRAAAIPAEEIAPPPLVTGEDLKDLGLRQGLRIGQLLRQLYDEQLEQRLASRQAALTRARALVRDEPNST
jgi:tRNA nucleotidyltransferase/poly(A) polymerase